jgi:excisionase family DNA binding protein
MNKSHTSVIGAPEQTMKPAARDRQMQPGAWLSVAQAAARADVCPRTVKRWIGNGYLPATRTPTPNGKGHLRIRLGDLVALLARGMLQ